MTTKQQGTPRPDLDIDITVPVPIGYSTTSAETVGPSLALDVSLSAFGDSGTSHELMEGVIDILGSAVAIDAGWVPPEEV